MIRVRAGCALAMAATVANAQAPAPRVRPAWVTAHMEFLASDALRGRGSATPDELVAATYVASQFRSFGLVPGGDSGSFLQLAEVETPVRDGHARLVAGSVSVERGAVAPRRTANVIGRVRGTDPAAGAILVTAHLDHLGIGRPVAGDSIYNGADDDASGTTAVLELARALAAGPAPTRDIYFVCFGSEELGALGAQYFREHPPVPLSSIVANVEFEMIGTHDPQAPPGSLIFTGFDRSNLGAELQKHGARIVADPYVAEHLFDRSDNFALARLGVVAHTAGTSPSTVPFYHRPNDDLSQVDIAFMTEVIQSFVEPLRWLASSTFRPEWIKGGRP